MPTEEEKMKEILGGWIAELHRRAPDSIGDLLHFKVLRCDPQAGDYFFQIETDQWMQNAFGSLHGGVIATIMDQGMGMLATCLMKGTAITPSIQIDISYLRPLMPGDGVALKVHLVSVTKTLIHVQGEVTEANHPDKPCAIASGTFFIKPIDPEKYF